MTAAVATAEPTHPLPGPTHSTLSNPLAGGGGGGLYTYPQHEGYGAGRDSGPGHSRVGRGRSRGRPLEASRPAGLWEDGGLFESLNGGLSPEAHAYYENDSGSGGGAAAAAGRRDGADHCAEALPGQKRQGKEKPFFLSSSVAPGEASLPQARGCVTKSVKAKAAAAGVPCRTALRQQPYVCVWGGGMLLHHALLSRLPTHIVTAAAPAVAAKAPTQLA